ncbi:Rhodomycin D methylesterase DauP [Leucobacter aridicollis]|uniref:alpha/beta fold hydrolase n=1 Tax=Leucobacter aridicollis TaxID=283878 RepID=UPI0037CB4A9C
MARITDEQQLHDLLEPDGERFCEISTGRVNYSLLGTPLRGTVLLVAGLSMHRTAWSPELIAGLHAAGYATLAADNRDAGLTDASGRHAGLGAGDEFRAAYGLVDMAGDLRELILALDVGPVHVVGMSMGGMIAQHLALLAPELVSSLTSVMSTTGDRAVGRPQQESKWVFLTPAPTDSREAYLAFSERYHAALAGPHYPDFERARETAEMTWARGVDLAGTARQLQAIQADGDRTERLRRVATPTLVVHGDADPLIGVSGGIATAAAIPGARLLTIERMGHSIPWQCAGELTDAVVAHAGAASA